MKKNIFIFFILIIFFCVKNTYAAEKIVFIDINFIFQNSNAGIKLQKEIEKKNTELQLEISKYKTEIENKRKKILAQKNVLSVEEYNKKVINLETKIKEMNSNISQKRNQLEKYKEKVENSFSENLNILIEEFSLQNSIDVILNKENLLMAKKKLDITEKIFNLFNERVKKININ